MSHRPYNGGSKQLWNAGLLVQRICRTTNRLTLLASVCETETPQPSAEKKHVRYYIVRHNSRDARVLFLGRWWGHFGCTSQQQTSQAIASFGKDPAQDHTKHNSRRLSVIFILREHLKFHFQTHLLSWNTSTIITLLLYELQTVSPRKRHV
jgi:hypothetical protein